ncbi:MAG: choice-of-anchor Q domain-containing protein [Oscillochloridaceae bacterium]|nr:CSLREA domain-containing protein [Chloroflexaceae bacterium]MDW8392292.1 choice-of-anchor Q domain-containing protein [Oscillochloridaceae bacterium]
MRLVFALLLAPLLLASQGARPVYAVAYVVNSLADTIANDTFCTLREAILAANNASANASCGPGSAGNDTITFSVSGTITLGLFLPNIVSGAGTLTIDGGGQTITISGNNAVRVMIVDSGADLTLRNLTISNASTPFSGGGVANSGTLTVSNSTFSSNSAGSGGGIVNLSSGTLTVSSSTFSGNSANFGGGIDNASGAVTVTNSTFSGNRATNGGGVFINGGNTTLRNTLISNSEDGGDCEDTLSGTNNNNLIESTGSACGLTNGANGNIIGQDPNLGALTGSPAYFPLNAGSPALNAGNNASCAATDQRGVSRPQGGQCDIGAFEMGVVALPLVIR